MDAIIPQAFRNSSPVHSEYKILFASDVKLKDERFKKKKFKKNQ